MMVANDIRHDTRVYKSALALADGGADVTVLGWSPPGYRQETTFGNVRIIRIPVDFRFRDARTKALKERRQARFVRTAGVREQRMATLRANLRAGEAQEIGGAANRWRAGVARVDARLQRERTRVLRRVGNQETKLRTSLWQRWEDTTRGVHWRRDLPELDDFELAYAPVIDSLDWELIHAHDVHHMGTAARAVARRRAEGRPAAWVYDAHEYVVGLPVYPPRTKRFVAAYVDLEQEFIHRADAVITVTPALAEHLQEQYSLPVTPTVVMNSPQLQSKAHLDGPGIREACDLADDTPLVVYSGGVTAARGVQTVVEALPELPGVHLAVVCVPHNRTAPVQILRDLAQELGVADRVHMLDPVAPAQVPAFLTSADIGIHPLVHFGGHEFSLPNKLFEYLHAGLPLVVSDCRALAEFVRGNEVGEVFVAEDPRDCARAMREVLARRADLHRRIVEDTDLLTPYSWEQQAESLRSLYRSLSGRPDVLVSQHDTPLQDVTETPVNRDDRPSVVGFGPANMAGQGWAWAKSLEKYVPGVRTHVTVVDHGQPLIFDADAVVDNRTYRRDAGWAQEFQTRAQREWTHALLEAVRPLFGLRNGPDFQGDAAMLRAIGIRVGLVLHGSEARNPARHAQLTPWSPFQDPEEEMTARLQRNVDILAVKIRAFMDDVQGPVFVTTPDLLADVPGGVWLPVVVDMDTWVSATPVLERDVPVVLHAPSRATLKGSSAVDEALTHLSERGLVEYRRLHSVAPEEMPGQIAEADIVVDQLALGSYGVMAAQAMAAGRVVVGHVLDDVRAYVASPGADPSPLPIVEATPTTLESVIAQLVEERHGGRTAAQQGPEFVRRVHNGRLAAQVIVEHLGVRGT